MKNKIDENRGDAITKISSDTPVLLFGVNSLFGLVSSQLNVVGIVYDQKFGKPDLASSLDLFPLGDERINAYPIVVASCGKINTAIKLLLQHGHENLTHFLELVNSGVVFIDLPFNRDRDLLNNIDPERAADQMGFADVLSKDLFVRLFLFRKTYCLDYISDFSDNQNDQYFDSVFLESLATCERFVDVGGYDGDTAARYLSFFPEGRVLIYEPIPENIKKIEHRFGASDRVTVIPAGLSNRSAKVQFSDDGDRSSVLLSGGSDAPSVTVEIKNVEFEDLRNSDLIKVDIEGGEVDLLSGLIAKFGIDLPPISIACYHGCRQFLELPMMLKSLPGEVYLRHYTESIYESVLYYVPVSREI